jgi:molybdenum cofactor guanylyltransferase
MGVVGVIVAGGHGTRLGLGRPKALATVAGETLLALAVESLRGWCDDVLVAAPASLALPAPAGARRVDDEPGCEGPLGGVLAGLAHARGRAAFVRAVDFPFAGETFARELLARLEAARAPIVLPAPGGVAQPLLAAYGPGAADRMRRAADASRAVWRAALAAGALAIGDDELAAIESARDALIQVNTPADLARAEVRAAQGGAFEWQR